MSTIKSEISDVKCISIAFSKETLEQFGQRSHNIMDTQALVNLAIDFIEDLHKVELSRSFSILPMKVTCIGDLELAQKNVTRTKDKPFASQTEVSDMKDLLKDKGVTDDMLSKLSSIAIGEPSQTKNDSNRATHENVLEEVSSRSLIEEIEEDPTYEVQEITENSANFYYVKIFLPSSATASSCDLEVTNVSLYVVLYLSILISSRERLGSYTKQTFR